MKKALALVLALAMVLAAGMAAAETAKTEVIVFAAASLTESLTEIKALYEAENPGIELVFNFDSSGTLKTQIQEGAACDLFISAAPKQMNQLDITKDVEKNPDRLDFVLEGSRADLLENKVALVVPEGNPKGIESFDALAAMLKDDEILIFSGQPGLAGNLYYWHL